nr:serine hydrolase [Clostridia bacterium]
MELFHGLDVGGLLKIKGRRGHGVSVALAQGNRIETHCIGSGRFGQSFPVTPDMLFQAGSVSKPMFALTLLRYADKGLIDLDADLSQMLSDVVDTPPPLTFPALLSHTAGFNVHGFDGYRAHHKPLTLEDVLLGRGNSPRVKQTMPYGQQYCYSGGGITLAELAFTKLTGDTLPEAFAKEIAEPLGLTRSGFFQPLDENRAANAAFGGTLGLWEDRRHGYHYYPEHAAAGFWTSPAELAKIGIALSHSVREGGLLRRETALRMVTPVLDHAGLCIFRGSDDPRRVHHSGWNRGFLTEWHLSLTEDLCVAVMINRANVPTSKRLSEVSRALYKQAQSQT